MFDIQAINSFNSYRKDNPLVLYTEGEAGKGGMSPGQRTFHESQHNLRLVLGGNQIGKSRLLAGEIWFHATGSHPFREVPEAGEDNLGWVLCSDLKSGWANVSQKMREIEPPNVLHPDCTWDSARGYRYRGSMMVKLRCGSLIVGKGSEQSVISLSGATISWLAIDEICKEQHFSEARSRAAVKQAPVFMALTPIGRPIEYLRTRTCGDPDSNAPPLEDWDVQKIELSVENCPHRDPLSIERQINSYGVWERAQRIYGSWEGITTERWINFGEENVFSDPPENIQKIGLGWDHGEKPGNSVCYMVAWSGERLYVLAEYVSTERNTPDQEAVEITKMIKDWGVTLDQIDQARGDSNSAGRLGLGFSVNELLERGFAKVLDRRRPPFPITVPWKGGGSIRARARLLNTCCLSGTFLVHDSCVKLIASLRHWSGENNDLKHPYDAVSYISEVYLGDSISNVSKFLIG